MANCRFCNRRLPKSKGSKKRVFCNGSCNSKWQYHNLPEVNKARKKRSIAESKRRNKDPKWIENRRKYHKKWRESSPKFKLKMREIMRKRTNIKPENYKV